MKTQLMPNDFVVAVNDIKLAILQARAHAAQASNVEALKLYFFVGGYISKKTRSAKWGTGAIHSLSERHRKLNFAQRHWANSRMRQKRLFLNIGFSFHTSILEHSQDLEERLYYILACARQAWSHCELVRHLRADDYHHVGALPNNFAKTLPMVQATKAVRSFRDEYLLELVNLDNVDAVHDQDMVAIKLKMGKFRASYLGQLSQYLSVLDATDRKPNENPSIGLLLCEQMSKPVVQLTVQGYSQPIGIATYQALNKIPEPYKTLAPVIDGVRRLLVEEKNAEKKAAKKGLRK